MKRLQWKTSNFMLFKSIIKLKGPNFPGKATDVDEEDAKVSALTKCSTEKDRR